MVSDLLWSAPDAGVLGDPQPTEAFEIPQERFVPSSDCLEWPQFGWNVEIRATVVRVRWHRNNRYKIRPEREKSKWESVRPSWTILGDLGVPIEGFTPSPPVAPPTIITLNRVPQDPLPLGIVVGRTARFSGWIRRPYYDEQAEWIAHARLELVVLAVKPTAPNGRPSFVEALVEDLEAA